MSVPSFPSTVIGRAVSDFQRLLEEAVLSSPTDPGQVLDLETRLHHQVAKQCIDPVVGAIVQAAHESPEVERVARDLIAAYPYLRLQKTSQAVVVSFLGGSSVEIMTPYYLLRPPPGPGRKRGRGRRGKEGNGVYPRLAALGIHFRTSPALASVVAHHTALGTVQQTVETLALRGIQMDPKTVSRVAQRVAERGLTYRTSLTEQGEGLRGTSELVAGKRIAIGIDGGRVRTRVERRGRRKENGRRGFEAEWREPKVFVVYEIDEKGRKARRGVVRYDATMEKADSVFAMLAALLISIGADRAGEWIFVGDGAEWIWERVPALVAAVGFDMAKVTEVVDFYHASQRLHAIAAAMKGWSEQRRAKWVRRMAKLLRQGSIDAIIAAASSLCKGRYARSTRSLIGYFETHKQRMRYAVYKKMRIPLGSGAVESGVRRIVNLRLKGNGIFWTVNNAEGILHLRAQVLSGEWETFIKCVMKHEVFWHQNTDSLCARKAA